MENDQKAKMDDDLRRKLDRLCSMKLQPALHLSQRFDSIISSIDFDAESILDALGNDAKKPGKQRQTLSKTNEDSRFEFIRILKLLETSLHARLLPNEVGKDFTELEDRVKEFGKMSVGRDGGINQLEDAYIQLVLEITEMMKAEEIKIFGNQTIFYLSSDQRNRLGDLYHFTGVFLTDEQIECAR